MKIDYSKEQEKYLRETLGNDIYEYLEEKIMPKFSKDILLHRIAKMIIRLTHKYHQENRDIVGELYENSVIIDQLIGQELERILLKRERGG